MQEIKLHVQSVPTLEVEKYWTILLRGVQMNGPMKDNNNILAPPLNFKTVDYV